MQWKLSDDRPIYVQLMETITAAIASAHWLPQPPSLGAGDGGHKPASIPIPCSARWQSWNGMGCCIRSEPPAASSPTRATASRKNERNWLCNRFVFSCRP